jgi:hypothetical protein
VLAEGVDLDQARIDRSLEAREHQSVYVQ